MLSGAGLLLITALEAVQDFGDVLASVGGLLAERTVDIVEGASDGFPHFAHIDLFGLTLIVRQEELTTAEDLTERIENLSVHRHVFHVASAELGIAKVQPAFLNQVEAVASSFTPLWQRLRLHALLEEERRQAAGISVQRAKAFARGEPVLRVARTNNRLRRPAR
jgi:hypothetical protein